ncbi:glycosyltransferase [Shewanella chilikensis]|uniref:glycosyltransferase n=1 Tax=Shewanella chilikensis TaxID=558541 RepID=UPI00200F3D29|nr:glycosyltransferase [Shewanella chilikensis]MCL1160661.1 glycosyltransferase [Shewanella chilikensis]
MSLDSKNIVLSVVVVTFNAIVDIQKSLTSLKKLGLNSKVELIFIDGGSTDGTKEFITELNMADVLKSEPDHGIYDAMNKGVQNCSGEWVYFLNAGDKLVVSVDSIIDHLQRLEDDKLICFGDTNVVNETSEKLVKHSIENKASFYFSMPLCHQSMFYRKNILMEKPFDLRYKIIADKVQLYDLYTSFKGFANYFPVTISTYYLGGFSEKNRSVLHYEEAAFYINARKLSVLWLKPIKLYLDVKSTLYKILVRVVGY